MPRPRLHDDALRTRLLEVTSQVISTAGSTAVTVRDVAGRAGTSASAVYALFGSREAMIEAVVEEGFRRFALHLAAAPRTDEPVRDLGELGRAYRASALADPHFYRVLFERRRTADEAAVERPTFLVLRDAVQRVLSGSSGEPPDAGRAEEIALLLWANVHGHVSLELAGLVPGTASERAERYLRHLKVVGSAAFDGRRV